MKKSTIKMPKSPAPATKAAAPAANARPASPLGATKIRAISPSTPAPFVTAITAMIDVGYGNALYLRGDGPGLSWEKGVPLENVAENKWTIVLPETDRPAVVKFLINDVTWCAGEDYTVAPGTGLSVTPVF